MRIVFTIMALIFIASAVPLAADDYFWESPAEFSDGRGSFPAAASGGGVSAVVWQEAREVLGGFDIKVHAAIKTRGSGDWKIIRNVGEGYRYFMVEPSIFNIFVDDKGRLFIAVAVNNSRAEIIVVDKWGDVRGRYNVDSNQGDILAPRIHQFSASGNYIMFASRRQGLGASIFYALSSDGFTWGNWEAFIPETNLRLNFLPSIISIGNKTIAVFQSFTNVQGLGSNFQLYIKTTSNDGVTWNGARLLTNFLTLESAQTDRPERYNNERPHLSLQNGRPFVVWERAYMNISPSIYGLYLTEDGYSDGAGFQISNTEAESQNPVAIYSGNETIVFWFDNRTINNEKGGKANRIFLGKINNTGTWDNIPLSLLPSDSVFARPIVFDNDVYTFYQSDNKIFLLAPDNNVAPPILAGINFKAGEAVSEKAPSIRWEAPRDSSGIKSFSYSWGRGKNVEPPKMQMLDANQNNITLPTGEDGSWYFSLITEDNAGNWSESAVLEFVRDTTPPSPVTIIPPDMNDAYFLRSNTFPIYWLPSTEKDLDGFVWNLEILEGERNSFADIEEGDDFIEAVSAQYDDKGEYIKNLRQIQGREDNVSFTNIDDGIWRFSVAPVDKVGNVGEESHIYFRADRYVVHTFISSETHNQNSEGDIAMTLIGRGFARDGDVISVFFTRDKKEIEKVYALESGKYSVMGDRIIRLPLVENLSPGDYYVGVMHPLRGRALSPFKITVGPSKTIKYGNFENIPQFSWGVKLKRYFVLDTAFLVPLCIFLMLAALLYFSIRGIGVIMEERRARTLEIAALLSEEIVSDKQKQTRKIKLRGISLRMKLALFTTGLVVAVVGMVAVPAYVILGNTSRDTLLESLWNRSSVLLESFASNIRTFLPSLNVLELSYLPSQINILSEARYVTITGYSNINGVNSRNTFDDFVWATNDPDILKKIDTPTYEPGISRLTDDLSDEIRSLAEHLNENALREVGYIAQSITDLTDEALSLSLIFDDASEARIADIQSSMRSLEMRLSEELSSLGREIYSSPQYTYNFSRDGNRLFTLYKPILFRQGSQDVYTRGMIRLEIDTESLEELLYERRQELIRTVGIVALAALAIGFIGAFILATFIIMPIRNLVSHIEFIRDTDDKIQLEGNTISINTKDELAVLADTINDMTDNLVKSAYASADLSIGKDIQKKFIPLSFDDAGNKLSFGSKDFESAEFFGYYEGAKGVSGDYFDYIKLDDGFFAIIKCDVAGKGIPAALIMIQVATMFINYFKEWKPTLENMHIEKAAYQINNFIESLGFQGRFAAFSLILLDSVKREAFFCNAGDNILHWYDAKQQKKRKITFPESPAAGIFPESILLTGGGYTVKKMNFNKDDILLLFTDGIEEGKRIFRDADFKEIICMEGEPGTIHGYHVAGQGNEEIGAERQAEIIDAVMTGGSYTLYKYHNPEGEQELIFNYSECKGGVQELIMAMISAEKVFRLYKNPHNKGAKVLVDKKVDEFLKKYFVQYNAYCTNTAPAESPGYIYYLGVDEDEQYDDLTILGIRLK